MARIAVLIKQVPRFEELRLAEDGRLERAGLPLEVNPYCRRAISKGVELARRLGGTCTVFTLGPPAAEAAVREAVAWGADEGVLISDPAFAGSDTLATARALAAALRAEGPFDLILAGRNSVDADTGQVGPEVAELLGVPFLAGVRQLTVDGSSVAARCEHDDGWVDAETRLPALLSCAERLCEPAKVDAEGVAAVAADRIRRLSADDLGEGAWGEAGSPTRVGDVRTLEATRTRTTLSGPVEEQVREAVVLLADRGALAASGDGEPPDAVAPNARADGPLVAVVVEPRRPTVARELLGAAAGLAEQIRGRVVSLGPPDGLSAWGADEAVELTGSDVEEDVAAVVGRWCVDRRPWALLGPGTMWGREVMSRVAARLGAGLTGDAVDLDVQHDRLVAWKPAFGGHLVAAITSSSATQMATVRPGMLRLRRPRPAAGLPTTSIAVDALGRVRHLAARRDDDLDDLARARCVVGVGTGVPPEEYPLLDPLLSALGAELAATRKVTDKGWQPRSRQVGITGRSVAPQLYVAIGIAGKFNHMVGVRGAGAVLAINNDPAAPVFDATDVGIVADWHEVVPLLAAAVRPALAPPG